MTVVLILGSGPNVVESRAWERSNFDRIVAINNAWSVRPDWDDLIHPDDFPVERRPVDVTQKQRVIGSDIYVPLQNRFGGFVYAGGTMAFTAAYWALADIKPTVIAMMGCDMVYPKSGQSHFYGTGTPDPLRADISLRSLEAKSARLMALAARQNCAMVNLSRDESRLVFPLATAETLRSVEPAQPDTVAMNGALAMEDALGYVVPSGKYWKEEDRFDPVQIDALDALWLKSNVAPETTP